MKQKDYHLSHLPLRAICRMVYGTCGTMGLTVDGMADPVAGAMAAGAGAAGGEKK